MGGKSAGQSEAGAVDVDSALCKRLLMGYFKHPQGLCFFPYPADWAPVNAVTGGAFFAAQALGGDLLFEAFALRGPSQAETIPRIRKALLESLRSDHPSLSVLSTENPRCDYSCELVRVAYSEKVAGRFFKVGTISDLYILADGTHALCLLFKVAKGKHASAQAAFEQVMLGARLYASDNW